MKTYKERTIEIIQSLESDVFITHDIIKFFEGEGRKLNDIGAALANLVSEGFIWRTGKTVPSPKGNKQCTEYTKDRALAGEKDATPVRGHDPATRAKINGDDVADLASAKLIIATLKQGMRQLRTENRKLKSGIRLFVDIIGKSDLRGNYLEDILIKLILS